MIKWNKPEWADFMWLGELKDVEILWVELRPGGTGRVFLITNNGLYWNEIYRPDNAPWPTTAPALKRAATKAYRELSGNSGQLNS